jgi:hypothetical protein
VNIISYLVTSMRTITARDEWERSQEYSSQAVGALDACLCAEQVEMPLRDGQVIAGVFEAKSASDERHHVCAHNRKTATGAQTGARRSLESLDILFERYRRVLYFVAYKVLHNHKEAEDAVQKCFKSASYSVPTFDSEATFRSWLVRVLIDEALLILHNNRTTSD